MKNVLKSLHPQSNLFAILIIIRYPIQEESGKAIQVLLFGEVLNNLKLKEMEFLLEIENWKDDSEIFKAKFSKIRENNKHESSVIKFKNTGPKSKCGLLTMISRR